ncbi:MAG: ABC transporter substrate-binding protein [Proteobacteria bacterium]|nr:ABC transporter substrate-binding protein [Pseudomonadota bacterium]
MAKDIFICCLLSCTLLFFWVPDTVHGQENLKRATFIPQWSPQAQFAGYFVAFEKGFYKKQGIILNILPGGPNRPSLDLLDKGEADFATAWLSAAIQKSSQGIKLVNVGQIIQRSALMLIAKKASGIYRPEDINGRKVGIWSADFQLQPLAFLKKYNLKAIIVPQSYSINLFLRDGVDVASAMWYNEYHTILNAGLNPDELTTFFFYEHGLNFPEDGIYTLESTLKKDPELVRAFVNASIEGWLYAFAHPDEALDIALKYMSGANIPANRVHQKWMLDRMKDLVLPENDKSPPMGTLTESDFIRVCNVLKENGIIGKMPVFNTFYVNFTGHVKK